MKKPRKGQVSANLQGDAELKRLAMWLATLDVDDLDDLRQPVLSWLELKQTTAEISQNLFKFHKKELISILDFNESHGIFFH